MKDICYKITLFSEWHTGSGLSSGSDLDALVIKDKDKFPFIPGKTLKGLLKEAAEELCKLQGSEPEKSPFITKFFGYFDGKEIDTSTVHTKGAAYFTDAVLSSSLKTQAVGLTDFFYRSMASTAIAENGVAVKNSLRKIQTTIPCELYSKIFYKDESFNDELRLCMQWIKRLGQNRHRGLGRCEFEIIEIKEVKK